MNNNENNFLIDCLVVVLSLLMIPYFTIKSIICDKSVGAYIIELRDELQNFTKNEEK